MRNIKKIRESIETVVEEEVEISRIFPNHWNFNEMASHIYKATIASLRRFGNRLYPVIVREIGRNRLEIIDGEHRWRACKSIGFKKIYIKNLGKIDARTAEELMLLLNESRGESDMLKLSKLMKDFREEFGDDVGKRYPFTDEELRDMEIFSKVDWEKFPDEWEAARRPKTKLPVEQCDHVWEEVEVFECAQCKLIRATLEDLSTVVDNSSGA